jgi:acetyl-CoA C-acetyltransferase
MMWRVSQIDPRTPVLVGTGQVSDRPAKGETTTRTPLDLMVEAARAAAADAGPGGEALLRRTESLGIVDIFCWPVPDPGALVARELGISPRETVRTVIGGNSPIALLADAAGRIAAGELDVALLGGGEVGTAFRAALMSGGSTGWEEQPEGTQPTRVLGTDRPPSHEAELAAGIAYPISYYPLFEHRLRHAAGRSTQEQRDWIGEWWARYSRLAVEHPQGWAQEAMTAEQLATPGPRNRLISDPYTRHMNADIGVDQAAMLLVTSVGAAEAAGIPRDRWVFVHGTAAASDHWFVGEREHLDRSPAIRASGEALFGHTGTSADDVALVDLYSCFPCAVQVGANELGFVVDDPARPLSVTGGLALFGGPANNYVTHSIATLADRAREQPGELALASAVGWYLTKHGLALLSTTPPSTPYAHHDVQAAVDATPTREIATAPSGTWTLETFTAAYDRDGNASVGSVVALDADGRRGFGRSEDPATLERLLDGDPIDGPVELDGAGGFAL